VYNLFRYGHRGLIGPGSVHISLDWVGLEFGTSDVAVNVFNTLLIYAVGEVSLFVDMRVLSRKSGAAKI